MVEVGVRVGVGVGVGVFLGASKLRSQWEQCAWVGVDVFFV